MPYSGYYVGDHGHIYGPQDSGLFYINDNWIFGPRNSGKYWLSEPDGTGVRYVYGPNRNCEFYITGDGHIYGPDALLPWLEPGH
jgi:hypothetical protein